MQGCWEIIIGSSYIKGPGSKRSEESLAYMIPEDAEAAIDLVLEPYKWLTTWYLESIGDGRPPAPNAVLCLQRDYELAWHIREVRENPDEIRFAQYGEIPEPMPEGFVPKVGCIFIYDWEALSRARGKSFLFDAAAQLLEASNRQTQWLCLLPELPQDGFGSLLAPIPVKHS
jgi:hypothetical protein